MVRNFFWNLCVNQCSKPFKGILVKPKQNKAKKAKKKKKTLIANATETSSTMLKQ